MSIEIDWEVTEAPADNDGGDFGAPLPVAHGPAVDAEGPAGRPRGSRPGWRETWRRRWWLSIPLALLLVALTAFGYLTQLGWQRVREEVTALANYEDKLAYQGETLLVLRVQDYTNSRWLSIRSNEVGAHQAAPLPMPRLKADPASTQLGRLEVVASDWVRMDVTREYQNLFGQTLTFSLPQFYRRQGLSQNWVRTGVPDSYWGAWVDWQSPHLFIRHSERDQELVSHIGPRLEALISEATALWERDDLPPARLFFSGYVGSLEYDPLANIRVRVEYGDASTGQSLPADYFLSVPSPQLAGTPADAATERYLADYLAVRLIASLADAATATDDHADYLTEQAVERLGLTQADPGYAMREPPASGNDRISYSIAGQAQTPSELVVTPPSPGATVVTRLDPPVDLVTYEVQPGDTLLGIALAHGVSAEAIATLNGLEDPDLIREGAKLLIPQASSE